MEGFVGGMLYILAHHAETLFNTLLVLAKRVLEILWVGSARYHSRGWKFKVRTKICLGFKAIGKILALLKKKYLIHIRLS